PPVPPHRAGGLYRNAGGDGGWQYPFHVLAALALEENPARQADDAGRDAVALQPLPRIERERDLRTARDEDDPGRAAPCVGEDVPPTPETGRRSVLAAVQVRHRLAG